MLQDPYGIGWLAARDFEGWRWHLAWTREGLCYLGADGEEARAAYLGRYFGMVCWQAAPALPAWLARALDGYLTGETRTVPVAWTIRGTPFQLRVWEALRAIPYGMVWTYGAVAERIGSPRAARAVGQAVAENPLALVVPCHRVVGARGVLGGYRGGTALKRRLLALEGVHGWR